ncbi:MAG TPA: ABC transporter permease, partial [Roseiflexaceae bacterium]|nr:ABC transporter permease [Roseiflexaceae bacterium]
MREFNPVLVKELRSRMRGPRAFILLTVYLSILSIAALLLYAAFGASAGSDLNAGRRVGKALFLLIASVALIEVCIITPALTSGGIAGEKERETYDLLVASLLSPWQIVWGKLGSALAFALLLILAVVPVMSLAFLFGGVTPTEVLIALAGLITTAVAYATIGLFWSALMRGTLGATILSLGSVILMVLFTPFVWVMSTLIFARGSNMAIVRSALYVYGGGAFISTNPFIALGLTEASLSNGDHPLYTVVRPGGRDFVVPSPWIVYIVLSAVFTAILLLISVRLLRPQPESR